MKNRLLTLFALLLVAGPVLAAESRPSPGGVKAITKKVADWQIAHFENSGEFRALAGKKRQAAQSGKFPDAYHDLDWQMGALYVGMNQWRKVADSPQKYTDWLKMIGERNGWKLGPRPYSADDHVVGQFYLALYEDYKDPKMLGPTRQQFDGILDHPRTGALDWKNRPDSRDRWGWCDALFMAPPVWVRLAKVTGERKYLDFMNQEYHATYDLLRDKEEHLVWRDSSFIGKRERNGEKSFGRGAMAG